MKAFQGSLSILWGLINTQQMLTYFPLFKHLKFPANSTLLNTFMIKIAQLNLIPTDGINEQLYELKEDQHVPYNSKFAQYEYTTTLFVENMGFALWLIALYPAQVTLFVVFYWIKQLRVRLSKFLFWNFLVRLLMEVYLELALLSFLNAYTAEWQSTVQIIRVSNFLSASFLATAILLPLAGFAYLCASRRRWQSSEIKDRFHTLFEALKLPMKETEPARLFLLISPIGFFTRRILFVLIVFLLEESLWAQIVISTLASLALTINLLYYRPSETRFLNIMEVYNELVLLLVTYLFCGFSDVVPDAKLRYDLGYVYIALCLSNILVNGLLMLAQTLKCAKLLVLKCRNKFFSKPRGSEEANKQQAVQGSADKDSVNQVDGAKQEPTTGQ